MTLRVPTGFSGGKHGQRMKRDRDLCFVLRRKILSGVVPVVETILILSYFTAHLFQIVALSSRISLHCLY